MLATLPRSPLMARLFYYLCKKYFDGETQHLSEVKIATEVFGRSVTFDRSQDAIARVEAHRLRKKLRQYYESEGKDHEVRIELPLGSYVPVFRHKSEISRQEQYEVRETLHEPQVFTSEPLSAETEPLPVEKPVAAFVKGAPEHLKPPVWWYGTIGLAAVLAIFFVFRTVRSHARASAPSSIHAPVSVAAAATGMDESGSVRLLCGYDGSPHIGNLGEAWGQDKYFTGGRPWPARRGFIRRASDPFLFRNTRTGEFSYDIPVKPGIYELHLYFVETEYGEEMGGGENNRTFLIRLNGATLIQTFDPLADAGGLRIADERVFKDVEPAADGKIHFGVESQRGQPMINAIELIPGIRHKQLPIRLVTQVNSYTDHLGQIWAPDNYYLGGQLFGGKLPVGGTSDPVMFITERAGNFSYALPVDIHGTYSVSLYFAETYFGPGVSGVGGVGSRVFNVMCNGLMLLDHFDIFKEAGNLRELVKPFHHLKPNAQGKLMLEFEPEANYSSVFAIEALDEST